MKKSLFLKVINCLTLCLLVCTILPTCVLGEDNAIACTKDEDGNVVKKFYNINDAMNASRDGSVYMLSDWCLSSPIDIVEGTTSKIYMQGHTIKRTDMPSSLGHSGEVITMHPSSKLYLYGSTTSVNYPSSGDALLSSGGFISGGCTYNGGGIYMKKGAYLYMEKVAVVGNHAFNQGGGVFASADNCSIEMVNAKISYNTTGNKFGDGGGVAIDGENFGMDLAKESEISHNFTLGLGGGVHCSESNVTIGSTDKTGKINYNSAVGRAGGIYLGKNTCSVSDLLIEGNSGTDAGGIFCHSSNVYLKNLTITNNKTDDKNGGGVLVDYKGVYLKDCKIYNNHAASLGGGVFITADYDINLRGCNNIYDNTSGKNNVKDDLYLENRSFYKAYVIGDEFDTNSKIGIRTGSASDRLIAKNITSVQYVSAFFLDEAEDYHIGFEAKDNEIWQRPGATTYAVKVNGAPFGKYAKGTENITVLDNNIDKTMIFVSWDKEKSSGLDLSDDQLKSDTLTFTMPGNEVNLWGKYVPGVTNLTLTFDSGINTGDTLPETATLSWTFNNEDGSETVNLNWYRKDDGRYVNCDNETFTDGSAYIFEVYGDVIQDGVHVMSNDIEKIKIKVVCGNREITINEVSVNDEGTINFKSNDILVGKDVIAYVDPLVVAVKEGSSKDEVKNKINANLTSIATSKNGYEYDVTLSSITDLSDDLFNDDKIVKNDKGYYVSDIGVAGNDNVNLDGITSTKLVINVLPKDVQTDDTKIIRITDDGVSVQDNSWYKEIDIDGTGYMLDGVSNSSDKVKLIGEKGKRITHELTVDGYSGKEFYTYILDDSKPAAPEFKDGERKVEQGVLYQEIIADYNYNNIFAYNPNGDNTWVINKGVSYTVSTESNTYKAVRALVWMVDSNNNMSDVSRRTYPLDNYDVSSFSGSFISKVDVTIDNLTYDELLPTKINKIDVTLSKDKVYTFNDVSAITWSPDDDSVKNNTVYTAKVEIKTTDDNNKKLYDVDYLSSLDVKVNNDDKIYAYIENENDKAFLYIIFPELEGSKGGYDDDTPLSYTLKDIDIGDYTSELSYEEALKLNNDLSNFDLPLVILETLNNNNTSLEDGFKADVTYNIVSSFNSDYYDSQEIVIEGTIKKPTYMDLDGISNKFTLKIKVKAKQGYVPEEVVNKIVTCEEYMKSKDWTWSESKKACVYRVSNTGVN